MPQLLFHRGPTFPKCHKSHTMHWMCLTCVTVTISKPTRLLLLGHMKVLICLYGAFLHRGRFRSDSPYSIQNTNDTRNLLKMSAICPLSVWIVQCYILSIYLEYFSDTRRWTCAIQDFITDLALHCLQFNSDISSVMECDPKFYTKYASFSWVQSKILYSTVIFETHCIICQCVI